MKDNTKARRLTADGTYVKVTVKKDEDKVDAQALLMDTAFRNKLNQ